MEAGWERPERPPVDGTAAPILSTSDVEGPLDWLVEQARARRIDLRRISVLALVETFEAALIDALDGQASALTIVRWGDWLVLAAELTLLRTRLMLPATADAAAARDEAETLRRRLVDRAEMAAAAAWLGRRPQLGLDMFERGAPEIPRDVGRGRTGDITALLRACLVVLAVPDDTAAFRVAVPFWTVANAVEALRQWRDDGSEAEADLASLLPPIPPDLPDRVARCRAAMASLFVGGLELTRDGMLTLTQPQPMGPIGVRPAGRGETC